MKKCTLCIDRIYNEAVDERSRIPACVNACPTGARHFGDLGDPKSAVSQLVAARGGYDLFPSMGYKPVNNYLPPRPARMGDGAAEPEALAPVVPAEPGRGLLHWIDRVLSR